MNFGFLLFDDAEELDFVGPWEIVTAWGKFAGGPEQCLTISQRGGEVRCAKGLRVVAEKSFENCPPLDYLLVPGGQGTRREVSNAELVQFVREQAKNCRHVLSVCTGAFILQAAGLLEGKSATTHYASLDRLRAFRDVTVDEQRFVRDGNVWTAAGVSAGLDLALALVAAESGEEAASKVQLYVEYYPNGRRFGAEHLGEQAPAYLKS